MVHARLPVVLIVACAALAVLPGWTSAQNPPGPSTSAEAKVEVVGPPASMDLIQSVLEFAPGSFTPPHWHPGTTLNLVLEGEITLRNAAGERVLTAGDSWSDLPGTVHVAGNAGATPARLAVIFMVPKGLPRTVVVPAIPGQPATVD